MQLVINMHGASQRRKEERFTIRIPNKSGVAEVAATKVTSVIVATPITLATGAIELAPRLNLRFFRPP